MEPFQRAIAIDPQFALAYNNLGSALLEMNQFANAMQLEVTAGAVTVNAGLSRFNGVVQADTVISNSVISAS